MAAPQLAAAPLVDAFPNHNNGGFSGWWGEAARIAAVPRMGVGCS